MKILRTDDLIEVNFDSSVVDESSQFEQGEQLFAEVESIYSKNPTKQFNILLDLTLPHLHIDVNSFKTVLIYKRIVDMSQTHRVAVLGKSSFADVITEIAFDKIVDKKVNWFTTRSKALLWLQSPHLI